MIYVASPYSSPDPIVKKTRFLLVRDFCYHCHKNEGVFPFSPIVYCYDITQNYKMPDDAGFWLRFNTDIIRRSDAIFLLKLPGWEESKGVKLEINLARMLDIPLVEFDEDFNNLTELNKFVDLMPIQVS